MEEMTPITRKETFLAKAAGQNVSTPTPVTREEVFLDAIAKGGGGGSGSLPPVTSADNGKVLAVEDGAWAASEQGKKFIVTLTPTALDYSGTMDKTVAEINAAYEAGMEIWFRLITGASTYYDIAVTVIDCNETVDYPAFGGLGLLTEKIAMVQTFNRMDGTDNTFITEIYALTPAS